MTEYSIITVKSIQIHGLLQSGISTFRGLQYGTIPQRFRQAMLQPLECTSGIIDARKFGPRCPQSFDPQTESVKYLLVGLESKPELESEFDCLRLNVYTPAEALSTTKKLPVLVWTHGGAVIVGDGNEKTGGVELVRKAVELGKPFVYVTINYRLGLFGFLHSQELEEEALAHGEMGYANQGLADQRLVLHWIMENIHHFGGDSNQMTLSGESAGAVCILARLKSKDFLCQRAIIMSPPRWLIQTPDQMQHIFNQVVKKAGIAQIAPASEKLSAVRNLSTKEVIDLAPPFLGLTWDRHWFLEVDLGLPLDEMKSFPSSLQGLIIGSTKDEITAWGLPNRGLNTQDLQNLFKCAIPDADFRHELAREYKMATNDGVPTLAGLIQLGTDCLFTSLAAELAAKSPVPASLYTFNQKDEFEDSSFKGYAYHALDNCFFARHPSVAGLSAPLEMRATSDFMTDWICSFVYGSQPWDAFNGGTSQIMKIDGVGSGMK